MVTSLRGVLFLVAMMSSLDCGAFGQQALDSHMPSLSHQTESTVEINDAFIKVTFGPVNLPTGYHEDLAVGIPERIFKSATRHVYNRLQSRGAQRRQPSFGSLSPSHLDE